MPPAPHTPTIGSLVWQVSLRWRAAVDRAVAPLGLTHAQYSALASLRALTLQGEQPSQKRLAAYTALGPIYISKLIRALEAAGLVARARDPNDARAVVLSLTAEGIAVIDRAVPIVRVLNDALLQPIGGPDGAETAALRAALQTLMQTAPDPDEANPPGEPL